MTRRVFSSIPEEIEYNFKRLSGSPHTVNFKQFKWLFEDLYLLYNKYHKYVNGYLNKDEEQEELLRNINEILSDFRQFHAGLQQLNKEKVKIYTHTYLTVLKSHPYKRPKKVVNYI